MEHWLEENCVGNYYFWSDDHKVFLWLNDEQDKVFYYMRFGDKLPSLKEINYL